MFRCLACGKKFENYKVRKDYRKVADDYEDVYVCPFCKCEDFEIVDPDAPEVEPKKVVLNPNSCWYCKRRSFISSGRCSVTQKLIGNNTPICKNFEFDEDAYKSDKEYFEEFGR